MNYLDNFLFGDKDCVNCDWQLKTFVEMCRHISFPISEEKTEWSEEAKVFLGVLLHGALQLIRLPQEKLDKADCIIQFFLKARKATVKQFMCLAGQLNFLTRALNYGRPFLRRIYDKFSHLGYRSMRWHLRINKEVKEDLLMWSSFLTTDPHYKTFIDHLETPATEVAWYSWTGQSRHDEFLPSFLSCVEFQTTNRFFLFFIA